MKNKEMYGLLCSELANKLQVVVCCPNYSAYPKVKIIIDWMLKVNHLHFPSLVYPQICFCFKKSIVHVVLLMA